MATTWSDFFVPASVVAAAAAVAGAKPRVPMVRTASSRFMAPSWKAVGVTALHASSQPVISADREE